MLKKIPVTEARVGMFLHRLEGAWIDHPFWKNQFLLDSPSELALLRGSVIEHCWIDTARGFDVADAGADAASSPVAHPGPLPAMPGAIAGDVALGGSRSIAEELVQAAAICKKGRSAVTAMFREARLGSALNAEGCLPMVEAISESVFRNPSALVSLARLKTADDYSYMHSVAVCALMVALARQLGHDDAACRDAGMAGLLHDLGKAAMPLEVLNKPGRLTDEEFALMKTHPRRGYEMLQEARGATASAMDVCLHHHERPDGGGYPDAMADSNISQLARMGSVCDVYDAITSNRPYKLGWDPAESIAQMASWQGQFDKAIFAAFVQSLGIYPVGSLVQLNSGRLAVVIEQNPGTLGSPVVKAFHSTKSQMPITPLRIDLSRPGCVDRIVSRESPTKWGFKQLDEFWVDTELVRRSR